MKEYRNIENTTNNQMNILVVIMLKMLKDMKQLYSDSAYIINDFTELDWILKEKGWLEEGGN